MKTLVKILPLLFLFGLLACQKGSNNPKSSLIATKWYLESIQYPDNQTESFVPEDLHGMNVVFNESNTVHALSSCNVFDGSFVLAGSDELNVHAATTKIFCTDSDKRLWDSLFYHNLNSADKYDLKDGILSIKTTKNTVLIFK